MSTTFDPAAFKSTTRSQWEAAAGAWHDWGPAIEDWLGTATVTMLDHAHLTSGMRVLDIAAGAGGQTLAAARRVGPSGHVLATDISPAILEFAAGEAARAGVGTVETLEADGEDLSAVQDGSYDAAISRVGLIYFPDQHRALTEICRKLRPGGRLSAVVYSTPDRNGFFAIPVGIIRRIAGLPAPAPGLPGPFSLGAPGVAEASLRGRRTRRHHRDRSPVTGAPLQCGGVRAVRAGVLRRPPPDALRCGCRGTGGSVDRDRGGTEQVRRSRRVRRTVRDARRLRHPALIGDPLNWSPHRLS